MTYELAYTEEAKSHLAKLAKDEPKVFQKAPRKVDGVVRSRRNIDLYIVSWKQK